jgi:pimeloyl-ACP methyl ester carboxylesterase
MKFTFGLGLRFIGVATLLAAVWPLYGRWMGRHRTRFPYLGSPLSAESYAQLAASPGWSSLVLEVAKATKLRGLVRRPASKAANWLLFYPGNDQTQLRTGQAFLSRLAETQDMGLAVFAYRGFDSSDGETTLDLLSRDAYVVLKLLCRHEGLSPTQLHVAGFSIGGYFAAHAVREAASQQRPVASLTLLASVDDIVMVKESLWQKLDPGELYQTRPLLPDVPAPVLVLQGSADEALKGPKQGRDIADALGSRARYEQYEGVTHQGLLEHAPALSAMRAFIAMHSK